MYCRYLAQACNFTTQGGRGKSRTREWTEKSSKSRGLVRLPLSPCPPPGTQAPPYSCAWRWPGVSRSRQELPTGPPRRGATPAACCHPARAVNGVILWDWDGQSTNASLARQRHSTGRFRVAPASYLDPGAGPDPAWPGLAAQVPSGSPLRTLCQWPAKRYVLRYLPGRVPPARTSRTSRRDATGPWLPGSARTDLQGWLPLPDPWIAGARHIHWRSSARQEVSIRLCATITWAYPGIVCEKIGQAQSQVELSLCLVPSASH